MGHVPRRPKKRSSRTCRMIPRSAEETGINDNLALTLVLRLERHASLRRVDALEAAAIAVLALAAGRRRDGTTEPVWAEWERAPRKLVRRARAGHWSAAAERALVHVNRNTAEVVGFPPLAMDETPSYLRRLQLGGTDVPDATGLVDPPREGEPVIWLNPNIAMTTGKTMAQVGHAAFQMWSASTPAQRDRWAEGGLAVSVRTASPQTWRLVEQRGSQLVLDGGLTEIPRGTVTAVAEWVDPVPHP